MLTKTQEKLIEILRASLASTDNVDISGLSDSELAAIYNLAKKHNVFTMAGSYLFAKGIDNRVILRDMSYAQQRVDAMDHVFTKIAIALSEADIPFLPLKGIVMRKLYPKPWMRLSGDIDILVHEADLSALKQTFTKELHYTPEQHESALYFITPDSITIDVETHLRTTISHARRGITFDDVWDYALPSNVPQSTQYVLSDDMRYAHAVNHMARHITYGGCGINHVMDLWVLNHRVKVTDEQKAARESLLEKKDLKTVETELVKISEKWFSGADTETDAELEKYILSSAAHGTHDTLKTAAVADKGKLKYYLGRIFVSYDYLKVFYPELAGRKYLTPVYEIKRWLRLLNPSHSAIAKKEIRQIENQDAKQVEQLSALFSRLGL